jgi:hypothetical protein
VETLEHLTSTIVSSDRGKFNVLKKDSLAPFMDYENVSRRIHALKQHRRHPKTTASDRCSR